LGNAKSVGANGIRPKSQKLKNNEQSLNKFSKFESLPFGEVGGASFSSNNIRSREQSPTWYFAGNKSVAD